MRHLRSHPSDSPDLGLKPPSSLRALRQILSEGRIRWTDFVRPFLLSLAALASELAFLALVPSASDKLRPGKIAKGSLLLFASVGLFYLLQHLFNYAARLDLRVRMEEFSRNLRERLFERCLEFGKLFHDGTSTAYLQGVIVSYTTDIKRLVENLHQTIFQIAILAACFSFMVAVSWKCAVFSAIMLVAILFLSRPIIAWIASGSFQALEARSQLIRQTYEFLRCLPLIRAQGQERQDAKRFADLAEKWVNIEHSIARQQDLVSGLHKGAAIAIIAFALLAEFSGKITPTISVAPLLLMLLIAHRAAAAMSALNTVRLSLAYLNGVVFELNDMFCDEGKYLLKGGTRPFNGLRSSIELKGLQFSYPGGREVLKDISAVIEKGTLTAIIGSSGVGKTTIINLIQRNYDCPPASIFIDGVDIREFSLQTLRERISVVSQDVLLFDETLRANITYGLNREISDDEMWNALRRSRLTDLVESLPLGPETRLGEGGARLSSGQKQRVSIARALLKRAEIVILDEATNALDLATERLVREALEEVIQGQTTILITHRISSVRHADKIIVVEDGRVIEQASPRELRGGLINFSEATALA